MDTERKGEHPAAKRSWREWLQGLLPEGRMRILGHRPPRDWFELLTRIPILERIVIKRFVENLMCKRWLEEPNAALQGMSPNAAAKDAQGRGLLQALLTRMASNRERTPREMRKIRKHLGL